MYITYIRFRRESFARCYHERLRFQTVSVKLKLACEDKTRQPPELTKLSLGFVH